MDNATRLTLELERAALHAIRRCFDELNGCFFRWELRAPAFELSDTRSHLGRWVSSVRVIELSRALLLEHGWGVLTEVLKHEMAHQYVDEVLGVRDEASHGPRFQEVCRARGFDAKAHGLPEAGTTSDARARVLDRIAKLLMLAQSQNEHEAQAAMSAAQRLMLKYNIDSVSEPGERQYTYRHLGVPTGRVSEAERILAALLGEYFFVEVIWVPVYRPLEGRRGSVLEVCGSLENVELAAYVHAFLMHTADHLWRAHKRLRSLRGDTGRRSFVAGVMSGFRDKLEKERHTQKQEGLVYAGDPTLERYFRTRYPRIRHTHYRTQSSTAAYGEGRSAGQKIVLHRGLRTESASGSTGARPVGLLNGKR
jgi:hypothetical protein